LIQTIGRAARNVSGQVHMYADRVTDSMQKAIDETNRRRAKQVSYNLERGVDPMPLRKRISDITEMLAREDLDTEELLASSRGASVSASGVPILNRGLDPKSIPQAELVGLIEQLTQQMHQVAADLQFELAARLRDEISDLKRELRSMKEAGI